MGDSPVRLVAQLHEEGYHIRREGDAPAAEATAHTHATTEHTEEHAEHGSWLNPIAHQIGMPAFVVWTWTAALSLLVISIIGTRRLGRIPQRNLSGVLELVVDALQHFARTGIGHGAERHVAFVGSLFIFILTCNLFGIIPGALSPTGTENAGLNTTVALGILAFLYTQYSGFRARGLGYLKHFVGDPWWLFPLNIPIHVIGELARPVSLAVRLYGNIGGEDKILVILAGLWVIGARGPGGISLTGDSGWFPGGAVLHFPLTCFAVFTAFLQALVFSALTCAYVAGATAHHEETHEQHTESLAGARASA